MRKFLCQDVRIFPNYILLAIKINISVVHVTSSLYVLNCFKYFLTYNLGQNASKSASKNFELYQVFMY